MPGDAPQKSIAFDRAAGYYDQTRGFPPGVERAVAALMARAAGLGPTARALEIGIGTGRSALPLAAHAAAVYGVDLAMPMIDRLIEKRRGEAVYPAVADATRLPFPDRAFDAVIAVHVFHLIPAYPLALAEAARVLRPGGVLAHGWNVRHANGTLSAIWRQAVAQWSESAGIALHDEREHAPAENGWQLQHEEGHTYTVENIPARYIEDLRARVYSRCWDMPDAMLQAGLTAVQAHLDAQGIDPSQPEIVEAEFRVQTFLPPR